MPHRYQRNHAVHKRVSFKNLSVNEYESSFRHLLIFLKQTILDQRGVAVSIMTYPKNVQLFSKRICKLQLRRVLLFTFYDLVAIQCNKMNFDIKTKCEHSLVLLSM